MRIIFFIFFGASFFVIQKGFSQMKSTVNMPSPNAASLGSFGKTPVSYYTGTSQISLPLYNVKSDNAGLPIDLSYSGTGVMPDRHPGWTGLNWTLSAGGVIVRTVKDLPDDNYYYHYWKNAQTNTIANAGYYYNYAVCNSTSWETSAYVKSLASDWNKDWKDTEPDEFVFNFAGYSGAFYLGEDGGWKVRSNNNIKVTFNNTFLTLPNDVNFNTSIRNGKCFSGFTITTDDGTKYIFGGTLTEVEYSIAYQHTSYYDYVANSWNLSQIISPEGQVLNFTYEKDGKIMDVHRSMFHSYKQEYRTGYFFCETHPPLPYAPNMFHFEAILISPSYLTKISNSTEEVIFHRSTSTELRPTDDQMNITPGFTFNPNDPPYRFWVISIDPTRTTPILGSDLAVKIQWKKLDKITIVSKIGGANLLFSYEFTYNNSASERLMLQSIRKKDPANATIQTHEFAYFDNGGQDLPSYVSTKVDHWGYYNAKTGNTALENWGTSTVPESVFQNYWSERVHSTDLNVLHEGSLKRITYPTGGFSEFIYEPHSYSKEVDVNRSSLTTGSVDKYTGGLRIKKIIDGTSDYATNNITRDFFYIRNYSSGGSLSSGVLNGQSKYFFDFAGNIGNEYLQQKIFSSYNILPFSGNSNGLHLGYSEVTEKLGDGSYKVYKYSNFDNGHQDEIISLLTDIPSRVYTPYDPFNDKSLERGHLLSTEIFNNGGIIVSKEINAYMALNNAHVRSINTGNLPSCDGVTGYATCFPYRTYIYKFMITENQLYSYQNGLNPIITKTNYYYDNPNMNYPTRVITIDSKGNDIIVENKYPADFSTISPYNEMITRNILSPAIEEITKRKVGAVTQELSRQKTNFQFWQSNLFIKPASLQKSILGQTLVLENTINSYDIKGNLLQTTGRNGVITSYLWGYNSNYPVAKITNATNGTVENLITRSILDNPSSDATLRSHLNNLRLIPGAFVNTYTYKPLVGITSETDPNGKTIYYEYDSFNRLSLIRDHDNNILKKICYNYAGQIENCDVACTSFTSNWQNTTTALRCQQNSCGNTGYQEQEQKDINNCSPSYNQIRWVVTVQNTAACPLPTCVAITSTNTLSGFTASYYNIASAITYTFAVASQSGLQAVGSIPAGNYNLTISRTTGAPIYTTFKAGCKFKTIEGTSAVFYNLNISTTACNSITIEPGI